MQDKIKTPGNMWTVFNKSKTNLIARGYMGYMGNERHAFHVYVKNLPIFLRQMLKLPNKKECNNALYEIKGRMIKR